MTPDQYRDWPTQQLWHELEVQQWRLAEYEVFEPDDVCGDMCRSHSIQIVEQQIAELQAVIERREWLATVSKSAPSMPKRTHTDIFRTVKAAVPLEVFCQRYGPILALKGKDSWGLCPMPDHHEKRASFKVSHERQQWYCFGCHRGGDLFTLAGYYYQESSVIETARKVAREFGIAVDHSPQLNDERMEYTMKRPDGSTAKLNTRVR